MKGDDIRFIIDVKEKDLYVFSAMLLHRRAALKLGIDFSHWNEEDLDRYIFDYGTYSKGKIKVYKYGIEEQILKDFEKYFTF